MASTALPTVIARSEATKQSRKKENNKITLDCFDDKRLAMTKRAAAFAVVERLLLLAVCSLCE